MSSKINVSVLSVVNQIVATGSVDGVLTTAAVLRHSSAEKPNICFAQAFTVDKVDPTKWTAGRNVCFVDLAVNNRKATKPGEVDGFQMTLDFVRRVLSAGHQITAICDEHNADDWKGVLTEAGVNFDSLLIKPCTQAEKDAPKSSGALLASVLMDADEHTQRLCEAAEFGDRMQFVGIGELVNKAMKAKIADDQRRVDLACHFSNNVESDSTIQGWIKEYEEIEANHEAIIAAKKDCGDGIVEVVTTGKVDMTTLMGRLYKLARVVMFTADLFDKTLGKKVPMLSFGIPVGKGDILSALTGAGLPATGFKEKANLPLPADKEQCEKLITQATEIVRAWVRAQK